MRVGVQGGCVLRSEAFVNSNFFFFFFFFGGGGVVFGGGFQGGCECRSEVFVKIQKKNFFFVWGGGGGGGRVRGGAVGLGGVRLDGNGELKLL